MNKKRLKMFLILILLLLLPYKVSAYNFCTSNDSIKLHKLANNVSANYTYYEVDGNLKFKINIYNLNPNIYIYDSAKKQTYYSTGEITIENYGPNRSIEYKIYSNLAYCKGQYLNSLFVTLPPYNPYYKDKLCNGLENYTLCRRWANVSLTYEEFKKEMTDYIDYLNRKNNNLNDSRNIFQIILDFYIKYYYIILPIIIIIGGTVMLIIKYKEGKDEF